MLIDTQLQNEYTKETKAPFTDSLTGLLNYGFFNISLDREVKRCARSGESFTLALIDLDGSGYPDGLKGEEISTVVRIMAVVDIYDALVTDRPYRKGLAIEKAFQILRKDGANGKLDKDIVEQLIEQVG